MIRTIYFDGAIQKITNTKSIQLDVDSPQALLSGLRSQVSNFRQALIEHPEICIVTANKDRSKINGVSTDTFAFPLSVEQDDIYVLTPINGAGAEAVAYLIMSMEMSLAVATAVVSIATAVAVNIAVSIVMQALAPSASTGNGGGKADERPSFLYNGAINVIEQGYAVPLVYGTHTTGSIVVSAGVDVAEMPYPTEQETPPANGGGTTQPITPVIETWQWDGG